MKRPIKLDKDEVEEYASLEEYLDDNIRDVLDFDSDDKISQPEPYLVKVDKIVYSFELERGSCIEATWDHKIFEWNIKNLKQIK